MLGITCPKCKGQFNEFTLKGTGVFIDMCQLCHAIWFDKDEFWTVLKNKVAQNQFKKQGLLNKTKTEYQCPKCRSPHAILEKGLLPMTQIEVEHCPSCLSFLFDDREYRQAVKQINENANVLNQAPSENETPSENQDSHTEKLKLQESNLPQSSSFFSEKKTTSEDSKPAPITNNNPPQRPSLVSKNNLQKVKEEDFSARLFKKRLDHLKSEVHELTDSTGKPPALESVTGFFSRISRAFALIIKEPEILLFSFFQVLAICIAYLIWIQILNWIPPEVWESAKDSDGGSPADLILLMWGVVCVGLATLPIGFFTACIGAVHTLNIQGKESTVLRCCKYVFPKIWPLWVFSWLDGWITVKQIISRLPSKHDRRTATERAFSEAMYYAWKVGTSGMIPALLNSKNSWQACKNSFGFLKHKTWDIIKLRFGYSIMNWIIGIGSYVGALYYLRHSDLMSDEVTSNMYGIYFLIGVPLFIAVAILKMFIRPLYVLSLFDIYSDYMIATKQKITPPKQTPLAQTALWFFILLITGIVVVFLFRDNLGVTEKLSTPYK